MKKKAVPAEPVANDAAGEPIELTLPEDLTSLSDEELAAAVQVRIDAFTGIREGTVELDDDEDVIDVATRLADEHDALKAETDRRNGVRVEREAQLAQLDARVLGSKETPVEPVAAADGGPSNDDPGDGGEPAADESTPIVTVPAAEQVVDVTPVAVERVPVAAAVRRNAPLVIRPKAVSHDLATIDAGTAKSFAGKSGRLIAGGDYSLGRLGQGRSIHMGANITLEDLALIAAETHRQGSGGNAVKNYWAQFRYDHDEQNTLTDDPRRNGQIIRDAMLRAQTARNTDGSLPALTAAACGFCIPAQRVLDFVDLSTVRGLWNVPSLAAPAGRVEWMNSPIIDTWMTAQAAIDPWTAETDCDDSDPLPTKTVLEIDCPELQESCDIEDQYLLMVFRNMVARSWPEMYSQNVQLALKAYQYEKNRRLLAKLDTFAGAATALSAQGDGVASAIMKAVELATIDMAYKWFTEFDFTWDVVVPAWVRPFIRSDVTRRVTGSPYPSLDDATIDAEFAKRNARVQYVYGLQNLGGAVATDYPTTVSFYVHPAGALWEITQGTLDLGSEIRDNASNQRNQFGSFFEESYQLCNPHFEVRKYTLTANDNGAIGDRVTIS